jgi:aminoglycoside 3-N-acetyltransferase
VDGEDFISQGESFEKNNTISYGKIGDASIRLLNQRELVDYAVSWI